MNSPEMYEFIKEQLAFRVPRQITNILLANDGYSHFYCPSCNAHIDRDYQAYCCNCGQTIDWDGIFFEDEFDPFGE